MGTAPTRCAQTFQQVNGWLPGDEALKLPPFLSGCSFSSILLLLLPSPANTQVFGRADNYRKRGKEGCSKTKEWVDMFSPLILESSYTDVRL